MRSDTPRPTFWPIAQLEMEPRAALRDAAGTLPMRAVRYCEAVTSACGFGWWLYPPLDAILTFDGEVISYSFDDETFHTLSDAAPFPPGSLDETMCSPERADQAPARFTRLPEPGVVQVSLGVVARTAPGWSLLLRAPANLTTHPGAVVYEGLVETDSWRGPLFTNIRLTRTAPSTFRLHSGFPLVQAQPVPRWLHSKETMRDFSVADLSTMPAEDWAAWERTFVKPSEDEDRSPGEYAVAARKRQAQGCPA